MVKEGERTFLECLDQLEVARAKFEDVSSLSVTAMISEGYVCDCVCAGSEDGLQSYLPALCPSRHPRPSESESLITYQN